MPMPALMKFACVMRVAVADGHSAIWPLRLRSAISWMQAVPDLTMQLPPASAESGRSIFNPGKKNKACRKVPFAPWRKHTTVTFGLEATTDWRASTVCALSLLGFRKELKAVRSGCCLKIVAPHFGLAAATAV